MVSMMRIGIALQPVATALFANSPFDDGRPSGYLSWRSHIWQKTDPVRHSYLGAGHLACIWSTSMSQYCVQCQAGSVALCSA